MIKSIQAGRGLAALAVAIYHTYLIYFQKTGIAILPGINKFGYLGVPFFFVLSGFIIALAHRDDINRPDALKRYAYKRFVRVYPIYWLFSLIYVATALSGFGETEFSWAPIHIIENITLVHITPNFVNPPLKVGWTLFYEIRFYVIFGLAIFSRRLAIVAILSWIIGMIFFIPDNTFTNEFFSLWNFAFVFGILGSYASRHLDSKWWGILTIAGVSILILSLYAVDPLILKDKRSLYILPVSLGFMLIMLGLSLLEGARPVRIGRFPLLLGDASYSIYLVHSATISLIVALHGKLPIVRDISVAAMFVPTLLAAVASGIIAHLFIERPLLSQLQKRSPRQPEAVPAFGQGARPR